MVVGAQPACCLKPSNEGRSVGGEREVVGANGRSWMQTGACGRKQEVLESSKRARVVGKRCDEEATAILVTSNLKWPLLVIEIKKEGNATHLCMPTPFAAALSTSLLRLLQMSTLKEE